MAPALSVLEMNSHHPHLDKKEVRQAIAYSIDRSFIRDNVMFGYGEPATGPLSRKFVGLYTDQVRRYDVPNRLEIANKLLDDAGLKRDGHGSRFTFHLEVNSFGEQWLRPASSFEARTTGRRPAKPSM